MYVRICRAALGRILRPWLLRGSAALAAICCIGIAAAQVQLPEVLVRGAKPKPKPAAAARARATPAAAVRPTPANPLATQTAALNQGLNTIYAPTGTAPTTISHNAIEALPQGANATVEKIVLRFPGVTQDSAPGGNFHVRNEHANVQTRINGIMLPDGVSGFGTFLDTALIGNISLITGALPPQFGLRTSGVLDIWTRSDAFNNTGNAGIYGGSRGTFTPSIEYGGTVGQTQYFISVRFFESNIGLENTTPNWNAIHDHTAQERGFGYVSTLLDPYTRFTFIIRPLPDTQHPRPDAELHRLRHLHLRFGGSQREPVRAELFRGRRAATLDQWRRRAVLLFHALQQRSLRPRRDRRYRL